MTLGFYVSNSCQFPIPSCYWVVCWWNGIFLTLQHNLLNKKRLGKTLALGNGIVFAHLVALFSPWCTLNCSWPITTDTVFANDMPLTAWANSVTFLIFITAEFFLGELNVFEILQSNITLSTFSSYKWILCMYNF